MTMTSSNGPAPTAAHAAQDASPLAGLLDQPMARYKLALEPQTFDEGWRVAEICAQLRLCGVQSAGDAYARIITGRAIGLPAMASVQGICLIENKSTGGWTPCLYAKLKVALILSRPDVIEYFRPDPENNDKTATWRGKRVGHPEQAYTFTIEDAIRAELVGRGTTEQGKKLNNYDRHPRAMLAWRAAGRLADLIAGDVLNGIASREDVEEDAERQVATGEPAKPAAPVVPARDWAGEAGALKAALSDAVANGDGTVLKAARALFKKFEADAPADHVQGVLAHYNELRAKAAKPTATPATMPSTVVPSAAPAIPPAPPTPRPDTQHTAAAARAAAAARTNGKAPYLPPHQRGDAYEGPESPDDALFGPSAGAVP